MFGISGVIYAIAIAALGFSPGVLSLGPQQYGAVNVLYVPGASSGEQDFLPPDPCVVDIAVFDGQGNQVKFREASLEPGQSAVVTFDFEDLNNDDSRNRGGNQFGNGGGNQFGNGGGNQFGNGEGNRPGNQGIFTTQATVEDTCGSDNNCDASLCSVTQAVEIIDNRTGVTRALVDGPVPLGEQRY